MNATNTNASSRAEKIVAAITVGQSPRVDITADILPLLPSHVTLKEYGALDDYTLAEVERDFAPNETEPRLVSRMRDGSQALFAQRHVVPLVQIKIDQAEADGADLIILFCTGEFPPFRHNVLFIEPEDLFHSVAQKLASTSQIGVFVPMESQIECNRKLWNSYNVNALITHASPYLLHEDILKAAAYFKDTDVSFICADCMGYSAKMKAEIQAISGKPVLLPRTLVARIICELLI